MIKITEDAIIKHLGNKNYTFEIFDKIDSTNLYARNIISSDANNKVIIANMQTNGRGRMGRFFYSPSDNGIYMSVILKVSKPYSELELFTIAIASITHMAIKKTAGINCGIKWVNDIFLGNKKICGILCESIHSTDKKNVEYIIAGIGINVYNDNVFPDDLKDIAGAINNKSIDRNEIIAEILKEIDGLTTHFDLSSYLDYYKENSIIINKYITFLKDNKEHRGKVIDINNKGNLIVITDSGEKLVLNSGEIRIDINNVKDQ